jgi:fatty acid-binding protein DegV
MSSCGQRAALDVMSGYLDDWARQGEHLRVGVGDADNAGVAELLAAELAESKSVVELVRYNIGPSVAVHTGPGECGRGWTAI